MGLFDKFFGGLGKTRQKIDLEELFQDYAPDSEQFYEDLEEMLILADAGMPTAERVDYLMHRKTWEDRYRKGEEAREGLIKILTGLLDVGYQTLGDFDGRGQRRRQDDHHRQAGPPAGPGWEKGHALRRRYLPCRCCRTARDLGGACRL